MILATAIGWAVHAYGGVESGVLFGLLAGLLLAQLVPASSCAVPRREPPASRQG